MRGCSRIQLGATIAIFTTAIFAPASVSLVEAAEAATSPALVLPKLDPLHGKALFASKGCVVCHSINGVGGIDAAPLDASEMDEAGNPFEFFARMLAGMEPMLDMQEDRLGHTIDLDATELGDLVAFIHDADTQRSFSMDSVPVEFQELIEED